MRKQRTVEDLKAMSDEHILYEIKMFYDTIKYVSKDDITDDEILRNCLFESCCVHARNLLDFLYNPNPYQTDAIASEYFEDPSVWHKEFVEIQEKRKEQLEELTQRMNKRVSHLTWDRLRMSEINGHFGDSDYKKDLISARLLITDGLRKFFELCDHDRVGHKLLFAEKRLLKDGIV